MNKWAVLIAFIFHGIAGAVQNSAMEDIRMSYKEAEADKKASETLLSLTEGATQAVEPLVLGYHASANMFMAMHTFNPFKKLSYFNKGKELLQKAIEADEQNVELRFLRFAAQTQAPSFLGYNDQIDEDRAFLNKNLPLVTDSAQKEFIISNLKNMDIPVDSNGRMLPENK